MFGKNSIFFRTEQEICVARENLIPLHHPITNEVKSCVTWASLGLSLWFAILHCHSLVEFFFFPHRTLPCVRAVQNDYLSHQHCYLRQGMKFFKKTIVWVRHLPHIAPTSSAVSFEPLADVAEGVDVVLGLITSKYPQLEEKAAVIRRIHEAAKYLPLERLYLSPQCGFASCEIGNKITEEDQWRKIALVQEIAKEVWG